MAAFAYSENSTNVRFLARAALALFQTPRRSPHDLPDATFVEVNGERLATWSYGKGPTILLVHGWNGHAAQLRAFVSPLVDAGYRVVAFDQPAHGQSSGARTHGMLRDPQLVDHIVAFATGGA
jgi:alpha-beta hydrolase superfamily lysophospholipase